MIWHNDKSSLRNPSLLLMTNGKAKQGGGVRNREVARLVRSVVDSKLEHKYFGANVNGYNSFGAGTAGLLRWTSVLQGTDAGQRIGTRYDPVRFDFNYSLTYGGAGVSRRARLILFQWMGNDAAYVPTAADILEYTATPGDLLVSDYVIALKRQFHVLADMSFDLNQTTKLTAHGRHSSKNLRKMITDAGSVYGIGAVYSMWVCDAAASPGDVRVDMAIRLTFTDA